MKMDNPSQQRAPQQMDLPRVLFLVEGFTDIRFVTGLSEISQLTMAVPARTYNSGDLKERVIASGAAITVDEIPGGRLRFQFASLRYLLKNAHKFDVILCQELLRSALNGSIMSVLTGTPVVVAMSLAPVEYFRCRRERGQIGALKAWLGETTIRTLMTINGSIATKCLALGPYLMGVAGHYCSRVEKGYYYGVDTDLFHPVDEAAKQRLRKKCDLPPEKFVILLSSRISHEKDPETVLLAADLARQQGLDVAIINLGGGYKDFLDLAKRLELHDAADWVLARPAVHPMKDLVDYYQASDCLAQASLAEGLGLSPLEALATGTPAVCTAVGGLTQLEGHGRMTPKRDAKAMCDQFLWIDRHREEARAEALRAREWVIREWSRKRAF